MFVPTCSHGNPSHFPCRLSNEGLSAVDYARQEGKQEVLEYLEAAAASQEQEKEKYIIVKDVSLINS